jgi:ketosteroid isomerase-like protein
MSRENVEVVRRLLWAFNNDADAWETMLSPELVWYPFENNHTPTHGVGGAVRTRAQWLDAWDDARSDPEDIVGAGENVVATVHLTGRGNVSGVKVDVRIHFHFKVRNGEVFYVFEYEEKAAALEAAGLSE